MVHNRLYYICKYTKCILYMNALRNKEFLFLLEMNGTTYP